MGTRYIVAIDLKTRGNLAPSLGRAAAATSKLDAGIEKVKHGVTTLSGKVGGVADKIAGAAMRWGGLAVMGGATAAIGALSYGVAGLNNQLEAARISLGTIFSANGVSPNLAAGIRLAGDEVERMRQDAAALPGEFEDLLGFFTTAAIPVLRAGGDPTKLREMAAQAMATAAVAQVPMDQAAREFAMLVEGRAGAHNVFGMRLMGLTGDKAQEFNKLTHEERLARIGTELSKYGSSIDAFSSSFEGQFSTMIDNAKNLLRIGSQPLFEKAKDVLGGINQFFEAGDAEARAKAFGLKLVNTFEWGKRKIEEWGPAIEQFGQNAYSKFVSIWETAEPYVAKFGDALQSALKDPGTIDKLTGLLRMYIAAKAAGGVISIAAPMANVAGGLASMAKLGGAAGAARGAAALASAGRAAQVRAGQQAWQAANAAAAAKAFGGAAKPAVGTAGKLAGWALGGEAAKMSAGQIAKLGMAAAGTAAALGVASATVATVPSDSGRQLEEDEYRGIQAKFANDFIETLLPVQNQTMAVTDELVRLREAGYETRAEMLELAWAARQASEDLVRIGAEISAKNQGIFDNATNSILLGLGTMVRGADERVAESKKHSGAKHGGGGGGTRVQKVEIVVTATPNPSRVAREIFSELGNISDQKRRTFSRHAPNYTVRSRG